MILTIIFSVIDHSCDEVNCGDHGKCVQGDCNCTYPYDGYHCEECRFYLFIFWYL